MTDLEKQANEWLEDNPVCDADDLNKRERELVKAAWQAALSANGGEVVAFGNGDYTVEVGRHARQHAVFIAPASPSGTVGELAPPTTGEDKHRLVPGERVMKFPTEAQAFAVAEAIAGRRLNRLDGSHPAPPSVAVPEIQYPDAIRASIKMLRERFEGKRCDSDGVSGCIHCNIMFLCAKTEKLINQR